MALDPIRNFAISRVATVPSPADSGTTLVVDAGDGALFPDPSSSGAFNVVIYPNGEQPDSSNAEIVRVTARSTDTMTITREQESTSARTVEEGDVVMMGITRKVMEDVQDLATNIEDQLPSGDIVGTTDTQTLNNKTIEDSSLDNSDISLGSHTLRGEVFSLSDDTATSFTPARGNRFLVMIFGTNQGGHFGIAIVWTSPNLGSVQVGSSSFEATNTALTGTTGTDGKFTVSGYDGKIYVENRLGASRSFNMIIFG